MKTRLIIVICLIFISSLSAYSSSWIRLYTAENGDKYYVDKESIKSEKNYTSVWSKFSFMQPRIREDEDCRLVRFVFDCPNKKRVITDIILYNSSGKVLDTVSFQLTQDLFEPIAPDTLEEAIYETACK